jgi:pheromone shutdown protein TraB
MYASTAEAPVLLLGGAHVIDLADPLRRVLGERTLDGVAVELDAERAQALFETNPPRSGAASGTPLLARLWGMVQRRLGADLGGGAPGDEMKVAASVARDRALPVFLIDDPIRLTLANLMRSLPLKERVILLSSAVLGLFVPAKVVSREMERYAEEPEAYAAELRRTSPTLARVLVDDRNEHMADRLTELRRRGYGRLAVVVGDAHLPGLAAALKRRGVPVETIPFSELRAPTAAPASPA